jgi:hypothetical protein
MRGRIGNVDNSSSPQGTKSHSRRDSAIAILWLVFYVLTVGVAILWPLAGLAEFATR